MRVSSITKNAGKACNNRLYRHIRTFEKIIKNYFVIYYKYSPYFKEIIENPDYIFKDKKYENTAIASKTISLNSKNISVVVRIAVEGDEPWRKSSVITVMCENEKRYRQRVRNNIILYKRE